MNPAAFGNVGNPFAGFFPAAPAAAPAK